MAISKTNNNRWRERKAAVAAAARRMAAQGLTLGTSGNISMRVTAPDNSPLMAITPSATPYDELRPERIIVADLDGEPLDGEPTEGSGIPSTEALMHAAIYRRRADVGAVAHAHPLFATIAAVAGDDLPPLIDEMAITIGGSVRVSEYAFPSSAALAENAVAALGDRNAALLRNHGVVGVGSDPQQALHACELVERAAQVFIYASLLGKANPLPPDALAAQIALFKMRRQVESALSNARSAGN